MISNRMTFWNQSTLSVNGNISQRQSVNNLYIINHSNIGGENPRNDTRKDVAMVFIQDVDRQLLELSVLCSSVGCSASDAAKCPADIR
jgi:hypothetical protein